MKTVLIILGTLILNTNSIHAVQLGNENSIDYNNFKAVSPSYHSDKYDIDCRFNEARSMHLIFEMPTGQEFEASQYFPRSSFITTGKNFQNLDGFSRFEEDEDDIPCPDREKYSISQWLDEEDKTDAQILEHSLRLPKTR